MTDHDTLKELLTKYRNCLLTFSQKCVCVHNQDNQRSVEELEAHYNNLSSNLSRGCGDVQVTNIKYMKSSDRGTQTVSVKAHNTSLKPLAPNIAQLILLPNGQLVSNSVVSSLPVVTVVNSNQNSVPFKPLSVVASNQKLPITRLKPSPHPIKRLSNASIKVIEKRDNDSKKKYSTETKTEIITSNKMTNAKQKLKMSNINVEPSERDSSNQCKILGDRGIKLNLTVRERMTLNLKRLRNGEISSFKDDELNLTVCTKETTWAGELVSRIVYQCAHDNCDFESASKYSARDHSLSHSGLAVPTFYWCDICGNTYEKKMSYLKHKYSAHKIAEKPVLSCNLCDYKTIVSDRLKEHSFVHVFEKPVKCDVTGCHKYFKSRLHLRKHKYCSHLTQLKCQFPGCDAKFKDYIDKHRHWKIHRNLPTSVTKLREQMEAGQYALTIFSKNECISEIRQKFVNQGNEKTVIGARMGYKCNQNNCPIVTITLERMNRHLMSHSEEQPFECDICHKKYRDKTRMKLHRDEQHLNKKRPLLYCPLESCSYQTRNKSTLKAHCLTHEENRPLYTCDVDDCDKTFTALASLKIHKRNVHSGERPYPCEWPGCEKRFKMNATMKKHLRSHCDKGLRFECHLCESDYRYKSDLNKHLKTKH